MEQNNEDSYYYSIRSEECNSSMLPYICKHNPYYLGAVSPSKCSPNIDFRDNTFMISSPLMSATACQQICLGQSSASATIVHVVVNKTHCICPLNDEFSGCKFEATPTELTRCNGNMGQFCGGDGYYSVYKIKSERGSMISTHNFEDECNELQDNAVRVPSLYARLSTYDVNKIYKKFCTFETSTVTTLYATNASTNTGTPLTGENSTYTASTLSNSNSSADETPTTTWMTIDTDNLTTTLGNMTVSLVTDKNLTESSWTSPNTVIDNVTDYEEITYTTEMTTTLSSETTMSSGEPSTSKENATVTYITNATEEFTVSSAGTSSGPSSKMVQNATEVNTTSGSTSTNTTSGSTATVSTAKTTATTDGNVTTVATTPAPVTFLPTVAPDFVRYPVSTDFHVSDLSENSTVIGDGPPRTVPGPFGFGSAIGVGYEEKSCVSVPLPGKSGPDTGTGARDDCLRNLEDCSEGFSMSIWENVNFDAEDEEEKYIVSSGRDTEGSPGVSMYHTGVDLHAVVSNGSHEWYVYAPGPVPNNTWSNIGIRWNSSTGLELYVDKARVGHAMFPGNESPLQPKQVQQPARVTVACHSNNQSHGNFLNAKFDELAMWTRRLNDTEVACFLGGYDAIGANMSTKQLADIIKTKMNLTDPEQRKQAVVLLVKMTDTTGEEAEAIFTAVPATTLRTTRSIAVTVSEPSGNGTNVTVTTSPWTTSSSSATTESVPVDLVISAAGELETVAEIVALMTNPETLAAEVTMEQLMDINAIITVVSNVFSTEKAPEWRHLQKTKAGSAAVVNGLETMAMASLQRTRQSKRRKTLHIVTTTPNIVLTSDRMSVGEFEKGHGLTVPNYTDPEWDSVLWNQGTKRLPLDTVTFSRDLFSDLGRDKSSLVSTTTFVYDTYDELAPKTTNTRTLPYKHLMIDSKVMSVRIEPFDGLDYNLFLHPLMVTLAHNHKEATIRKLFFHDESKRMPSIKKRFCVSWNKDILPFGAWDTVGCEVVHSNADYTICMCDKLRPFAIMAQTIRNRKVEPDPEWLMITKYTLYAVSALCLIFYMAVIMFSKYLKDQFHVVKFNLALVALGATACMFATDYVRDQRHECTAVSAVMHFGYVAVAAWLMLDCHAVFAAVLKGIVGGKLTAYFPLGYGLPMISLGLALYGDMDDYGWEPRCMVSWNDHLKWTLFAPVLILAVISVALALVSMINISFAALKSNTVFEDMGSTSKGQGILTGSFAVMWGFACLAYLDLEFTNPNFYPIFQILNASLGVLIFIFTGLCSNKFRIILSGKVPDTSVYSLQSTHIRVASTFNRGFNF